MNFKVLVTSKTFWSGIIGIITGVGMLYHGNTSTGVQTVVMSVIGICLRDAVSNLPQQQTSITLSPNAAISASSQEVAKQ